jgi:hypothetical protein
MLVLENVVDLATFDGGRTMQRITAAFSVRLLTGSCGGVAVVVFGVLV